MTPELKAKELVEMFLPYCTYDKDGLVLPVAKACAIICCGEIINLLNEIYTRETEIAVKYYQQVKTEIQKL